MVKLFTYAAAVKVIKIHQHQTTISTANKLARVWPWRYSSGPENISKPRAGRVSLRGSQKIAGGCCLLFWLAANAQLTWLTIVGNPGNSQTDLIEVDPQSRSLIAGNSTLNIRVSRAILRTSSDGIPFRSYTATVLVDCASKSARFVNATFYMMPSWEGKPHTTLTYSAAEVKPMLFRSIEPNPAARIIRAACQAGSQ